MIVCFTEHQQTTRYVSASAIFFPARNAEPLRRTVISAKARRPSLRPQPLYRPAWEVSTSPVTLRWTGTKRYRATSSAMMPALPSVPAAGSIQATLSCQRLELRRAGDHERHPENEKPFALQLSNIRTLSCRQLPCFVQTDNVTVSNADRANTERHRYQQPDTERQRPEQVDHQKNKKQHEQ